MDIIVYFFVVVVVVVVVVCQSVSCCVCQQVFCYDYGDRYVVEACAEVSCWTHIDGVAMWWVSPYE